MSSLETSVVQQTTYIDHKNLNKSQVVNLLVEKIYSSFGNYKKIRATKEDVKRWAERFVLENLEEDIDSFSETETFISKMGECGHSFVQGVDEGEFFEYWDNGI